MKKLLGLIIVLVIFYFFPKPAFAANEFSTTYDVSYDIGVDGVTSVTQKITLKNLTSQYYASNFTLTIGSTTVSDITASDEAGAMEASVESKDNKTSITTKFNQQIAGIDKTQTFTLKFKSKDFASALGKTWEVNLPKIPESSNISTYNLVLSVPVSFGDPTSISPIPKSQSQTYDRLFFTFHKEQLINSGISVNFGTTQVFDFNLKYHLENNSLFPVMTSVALPPDTEYQDVSITRISPEPLNVTIDEDGNYLAWYRLDKRFKQDVNVAGAAKLYIENKYIANKNTLKSTKKVSLLSQTQTASWTKQDSYWEKDNPAIVSALSEVFKEGTPKTNQDKARLLYRFVVNTLKYDTGRLANTNIERLGAVTALNNPNSAVCMEFTDLFVALARAAGIPARELDGFAYSQNTNLRPLSLARDLLHAWPEYYDEEKGWVMVDPTWENTSGGVDYFNKFDLNHLVLAIKGVSSKIPYTSDDVKVSISEADFMAKPQIEVGIDIPDTIFAGFPSTASVKVSNQGNSALSSSNLSISTGQITVLGSKMVTLGSIPPFGYTNYEFNLRTPNFWQGFEDTIKVSVGDKQFTKKVNIRPFYLMQPFPYILIGIIALILGIYGTILGLHIYKKK